MLTKKGNCCILLSLEQKIKREGQGIMEMNFGKATKILYRKVFYSMED